jgi:hypothetical protein
MTTAAMAATAMTTAAMAATAVTDLVGVRVTRVWSTQEDGRGIVLVESESVDVVAGSGRYTGRQRASRGQSGGQPKSSHHRRASRQV